MLSNGENVSASGAVHCFSDGSTAGFAVGNQGTLFVFPYFDHRIMSGGDEKFSLGIHVQACDSAVLSQNNRSDFRAIYGLPIGDLPISGQSQDLTLTWMDASPQQSRSGC